MKKIELDELKKIELSILIEIDRICKEANIDYSLDGGSLLGAIRHQGFIPWDDDIDIFMTRRNYDKFIDYCLNNKTTISVISNLTNEKYGYLFAKAMDSKTIIQETALNRNNIEIGVFVDIFPVDYLGNSFQEAKKNMNKTRFLRELLVARNWKCFTRSKTHSFLYEPIRFIFFLLSRFTSEKKLINKIEKKYRRFNQNYKKYSGCICGSYRTKEIMETTIYEEYTEHIFENRDFSIVKKYDKYLTNLYNDYMKLPPKEKQITHHTFDAFYKD